VNSPPHRLNVLVATPLGHLGKGGVDRLMDVLRAENFESYGINLSFGTTRGQRSILLSPLYLIRFLARLLLSRVRGRVDLVHVNLSSRGSTYRKLVVCLACRLVKVPYVLHLHDGRYDNYWTQAPVALKYLIDIMFLRSATILVLGRLWRELVVSRRPSLKAHTFILRNVCERGIPRTTELGSARVKILFLGAINEEKGVPVLLRALRKIDEDLEWSVTLAGEGDIEGMKHLCLDLGLLNRVKFMGWQDPAGVRRLLASSTILVLPSSAEGMPISIIEGMAAGLAIVTTPVGAIPDIITQGVNGIFTAPGDTDQLAAALRLLIGDRKYREALGNSAFDYYIEYLTVDRYCRELIGHWRSAANARSA
jgi:glycosyltransferase involved in cell wall biosynthesis